MHKVPTRPQGFGGRKGNKKRGYGLEVGGLSMGDLVAKLTVDRNAPEFD